ENQLAGLGAQAGGEDAVIGAGAAAALGVAGHGDADVEAALLLELLGNFIGDGGILVVFQLLLILLLGELGVLLGDGALGHGQDGEAAAAVVARLDLLGNLVDVVGNFGDQNDIGAAGHAGVEGEPAHLVPHDLHDEDAA